MKLPIPRALRRWAANPVVTPTMLKTFIVVVAVAALAGPLVVIALPYIPFFNDMAVQDKVRPQMIWHAEGEAATPVPAEFAPVAGTIPRGHYPYPFLPARPVDPEAAKKADEEMALRAEAALVAGGPDIAPPFHQPKPDRPMLDLGKKRFETYCFVCHGKHGMGDGPVAAKGFPAPPNLLEQKVRDLSDARIFHVITAGQGAMPSYAPQLPPAERWSVVYYLRALQRAFAAPPAAGGERP